MNNQGEEGNGTIKLFFVLISGAFFYEFIHFCITPWRYHDASPQWLIYNHLEKADPDPIRFILSIAILAIITLIVIYLLYWFWKCYIRSFSMSPQNLIFTFLFSAIPLSFRVIVDIVLQIKINGESFGVEAKVFILATIVVYIGTILYLEREGDLWLKDKYKIFVMIFLIFLLMIINHLLIRMFMVWFLIFFLGKILYRILRKNRIFVAKTWDPRNWVYTHKKSITIFLLGFLFIGIYWSFFHSIRGSEIVYLKIDIRDDYYTELKCENVVYEYYDEKHPLQGYIVFSVRLKIEEKNMEGYKIRFNVKRKRERLFYRVYESFEKSYIEEWFTTGEPSPKRIDPFDDDGEYYYFKIPSPKHDEIYFMICIYVGEDLLPLGKEEIRLDKTIATKFAKDTKIISDFGNSWNVVYDYLGDEKIIDTIRDVHKLTSTVKETGEKSLTQSIDLERNYTRRALREARWGIFLSILLAGISLIISIYLYERRSLDQKH